MYNICDVYVSDNNECGADDRGGCEQGCTNTIGSFNCFCGNGFTLALDGKTCSGNLN